MNDTVNYNTQESDVSERFSLNVKRLRESKKFSKKSLAEKIGVSANAYQRYENGSGFPNMGTLLILADILETTIDELLRNGTGKQIVSEPSINYLSSRYNVHMLSTEVQAGDALPDQYEPKIIDTAHLPWLPPGTWYGVTAVGDSMMPTIMPGARVFCQEISREQFVDDSIYVVIGRHGFYLKRLRKVISGEYTGQIALMSDNERVSTIYLQQDDIVKLYRVEYEFEIRKIG